MKKSARMRANFVGARRSQRNAVATRSPYFIECFATSLFDAHGVVALSCYAMLQQVNVSSTLHDMRRARHVYTSLSRVSVFFIAL